MTNIDLVHLYNLEKEKKEELSFDDFVMNNFFQSNYLDLFHFFKMYEAIHGEPFAFKAHEGLLKVFDPKYISEQIISIVAFEMWIQDNSNVLVDYNLNKKEDQIFYLHSDYVKLILEKMKTLEDLRTDQELG